MINKPQDEWEKEFDNRFMAGHFWINSQDKQDASIVEVKDFIRSLAQSEYQRGIADMWGLIANEVGESETGFNQGIGEIDLDKLHEKKLLLEQYTKPIE